MQLTNCSNFFIILNFKIFHQFLVNTGKILIFYTKAVLSQNSFADIQIIDSWVYFSVIPSKIVISLSLPLRFLVLWNRVTCSIFVACKLEYAIRLAFAKIHLIRKFEKFTFFCLYQKLLQSLIIAILPSPFRLWKILMGYRTDFSIFFLPNYVVFLEDFDIFLFRVQT